MKTKTKLLSVAAMACICGVAGSVCLLNKKAAAEVNSLEGFSTPGASIYLSDVQYSQMRFVFHLENDVYEQKLANKEVSTGVIYMPFDLYEGALADFTLDTANRATVDTTDDWTEEDGKMTTYAYVVAGETTDFNRIMIARAYLTDGDTTYYTQTAKASMAYLAWKNYDAYQETFKESLDTYRGSYTLTYDGAERFTGAYGTTILLEDASKEGYTFNGWFWDEAYTKAVAADDYITGSHNIYAKFTGSNVSVSGFSLTNATVTLSKSDGTTVAKKSNVTGDGVNFEVPHGTYALTIDDGVNGNYFYNGTFAANGEVALTVSDFVQDSVNVNLPYNAWTETGAFVRSYDETDGVVYTAKNPAVAGSAAQYNVAPAAMPATAKFTASFDLTIESGAALQYGVTLGRGQNVLQGASGDYTPNAHFYLTFDSADGGPKGMYSVDYKDNTETVFDSSYFLAKPYTAFGTTFNLKIVRDNSVLAFFLNDTLTAYLNVDEQGLIGGGCTVGDTPMYYGISVRSNAKGTGSATFKNVTFTNDADLSDYFAVITGTVSAAPSAEILFQNTSGVVNGGYSNRYDGQAPYLNWKTTRFKTDASGNFSAYLPRANYLVEIISNGKVYTANVTTTGTADSFTASLAEQTNEAYVGSVVLNGTKLYSSFAALPNDDDTVQLKGTYANKGVAPLWFYMPNTVTAENFTFVMNAPMSSAFWGNLGASLYTSQAKISAFVADINVIYIDTQYNSAWYHEFKLNTSGVADLGYTLTSSVGGSAKGVGFKFIRTAEKIDLYAPCTDSNGVAGYYLILTMNTDGSITYGSGVQLASNGNEGRATDAMTVNAIKSFFADGAETACGYFTNNKWGSPTIDHQFYSEDAALIDTAILNGTWMSCDNPANASATYSADGSKVTLTNNGWGYYTFANTAGVTYTYEVQITGNTNWNAMPGVAIIGKNSSVVNFKFANWERFCVIMDVTTKGTHSDDYVYSNASSSLTGSENADKLQFMQNPNVSAAFNVTLKFVKTETNLIVYIKGATSDYVKLVELKADGSITLNEEYFAVKTDNGIDETETGYVKNLFGAGVETCLGITTTTVGTNVTYTVTKQ